MAAWILGTAFVVSGCSTDGQPLVVESDRPSIPSSAPPINDSLDVGDAFEDPCEVLTRDQLRPFGITSEGERNSTECWWGVGTGVGTTIHVGPDPTAHYSSLADLYQDRLERPRYAYFVPTEVDGYPAVFHDLRVDFRPDGGCQITVGVADDQYFDVDYSAVGPEATEEQRADPCGSARRIAELVLSSLQNG